MKRDADSPQQYLEMLEGEQREMLERIRSVIFKVAPGIDEVIQYGMLGYPGLANLGAQKHYVALYVAPAAVERHRDQFTGISCGKSCLRFKKLEQADPAALRALLEEVIELRKTCP